jgi:hypothetical protein
MSVSFTVELFLPGFEDTAKIEMSQRDGGWSITSMGVMVNEGDTRPWENKPRTYATAIDAFRYLCDEVDTLLGVGFERKSEVWEGV